MNTSSRMDKCRQEVFGNLLHLVMQGLCICIGATPNKVLRMLFIVKNTEQYKQGAGKGAGNCIAG